LLSFQSREELRKKQNVIYTQPKNSTVGGQVFRRYWSWRNFNSRESLSVFWTEWQQTPLFFKKIP